MVNRSLEAHTRFCGEILRRRRRRRRFQGKMMHMTFYWGKQATILFDGWITKTWLDYALSLVALLLASIFHEYLVSLRIQMLHECKKELARPLLEGDSASARRCSFKCMESLLYCVTSGLGFLLMLAAMSFNAGVFLSIVLGFAAGYHLFRSGKPHSHDIARETSCCT